ncbi:UNVERIFIED_CONTAM: hypothetical protein Slati_3819300 [Sesamum latifolium]|uniref:Retrotransposon gag domain-containing protein n=1 Tax=Sesamum latifolium TaxID=2727402 RepID=A0AAW2U4F7_9LAMI
MEIMGVVERPMMDYSFPTADGTISSIIKPSVEANNFEIKPSIIQIIWFNGVSNDAVRLRIFPFSLCDTAKDWLQSYLLLDKESLYDVWERFKSMLRKCPHHELPVWRQVQTFYNGVTLANRATIDAAAERANKRPADIHSIDAVSTLSAQMNAQITAPTHKWTTLGPRYGMVHDGHLSQDCQSNNQQQGSTRPHQPRQPPPQEPKSNLEDMFSKFIATTDTRPQNQDASIRNLEVQIGQLVSIVSGRREGQLPNDTKKNSRKQVNAIFVRNERPIRDEPLKEQVEEAQAKKEEESQEETKGSPLKLNLDAIPPYIPYPKRILKANLDKNFRNFLEIFKKIHVNIPLIDALLQMPSSAKFLKEVLSNKKSASVNLMPYSIFEKFGMHELTPSTITLQLADRSIKYPRGIVEDVLEHNIFAIDTINNFGTDTVHLVKYTGQEVKSKLQKEFLLNGSTSNLKVKPPFEVSSDRKKTSEGKWGRPNRMKRWRNQVDENVGFYKEHTKAWNESHMKKKKFKDGDKRHHKNKSPIKVDWQTLKHYIEGTQPPRLEPPLQLSTN